MKFLPQELLKPLQEKYSEFQARVKSAASDPPETPYKSKYAAYEALEEMNSLVDRLETEDPELQLNIDIIECHIVLNCGVIKSEVEEPSMAEKLLLTALSLCEKFDDRRFTVYCRVSAHNQLGIIWFNRDELEKARQNLETALALFYNFMSDQTNNNIWVFEDLLYPERYQMRTCEDVTIAMLITHTYYYLAQLHGKLGNAKKSAEYCHNTLARQLRYDQYEPLDWCANAATLSQFYTNQDNYTSARYHLACARTVFDKHFPAGGGQEEEEEVQEERREKISECGAHISRLCGKYGLCLLEFSHSQSVMSQVYKALENVENPEDEAVENPEFDSLDVSAVLSEVSDHKITNWDEAKTSFLWAQKHFTASQTHYTLNEHCTDYVEITRDISQLYKHLIKFEADTDRAAKMQRRRADLLEPLVTELAQAHYLLVIRQILFELGEIFSDLMDLKTARWSEEPNNPHHARKVNLMVTKAIEYFVQFLDTMKVEGGHPERYNEESVRPALLARFHLGRLSSKFVVGENTEPHLRNTLASYSRYKEILDYCETNPHGKAAIEEEFEICQEMVRLLPLKVETIKRNLK